MDNALALIKQAVANRPNFALESLPLIEILSTLLGKEGKRILELRSKSNEELFELYRDNLVFRWNSDHTLKEARRIITRFEDYLAGRQPSEELAKRYLAQFTTLQNTTAYRYVAIIGQFMKWYGEPLDIKVKVPKPLPQTVDPKDVDAIIEAMWGRDTRRDLIERDVLVVDTLRLTGLRRSEAANLKVSDLDFDNKVLVVRKGKGEKDRSIPLVDLLSDQLREHCLNKHLEDSVFGLGPAALSAKIHRWAKKAGCPYIHAHSLRHFFATQLARKGASAREIQMLMGHSDMATSQRYIDLTSTELREAINRLVSDETETRETKSAPVEVKVNHTTLIIRAVNKTIEQENGPPNKDYFSHFEILNASDTVAIELEVALLEDSHRVLQGHRNIALLPGKRTEFKPQMYLYEGKYYIVCQYKGVEPKASEAWHQTWLPITYIRAESEGEAYAVAGELQFKYGIGREELVEIFGSKPI
ncbi:tyrosine-type recombinase/integrase [Chloroflexota bacterium]